jgi:hypothetical protein
MRANTIMNYTSILQALGDSVNLSVALITGSLHNGCDLKQFPAWSTEQNWDAMHLRSSLF